MLSVLQAVEEKVWRKEKPIFTDGARWYNDACKWLRLNHHVYGTELKNVMERFIQHIKDRTENVSMTIFHVGNPIVTSGICMELAENVPTVPEHGCADRIRFIMFLIGDGGA